VLADKLGVSRQTIGIALESLERARLVRTGRGKVMVIDEDGLQAQACECYARIKDAQLTQAEFPFFAGDVLAGPGAGVPTQIWEALRRQEPATVRQASEALLTTFARVIVSLIGERLTWQFLFDLSPEAFRGPEQERTG
jgi:predicted ArsR family transcriptional regulator